MAAIDAASGTWIIVSMTVETKDGSILGRPMPSIRDPVPVRLASPLAQPAYAEPSGSTTAIWVVCRWYRT